MMLVNLQWNARGKERRRCGRKRNENKRRKKQEEESKQGRSGSTLPQRLQKRKSASGRKRWREKKRLWRINYSEKAMMSRSAKFAKNEKLKSWRGSAKKRRCV